MAQLCCMCWGGLRILCYNLCCEPCVGKPRVRPTFDVLMLGPGHPGKTSILTVILQEDQANVQATQGFGIKAVGLSRLIFSVKEVAGAAKFRPYWSKYYDGSQGLVYVLDAAEGEERIRESVAQAQEAAGATALKGYPLLVLLHKTDSGSGGSGTALGAVEAMLRDAGVLTGRRSHLAATSLQDRDGLVAAFERFAEFFVAPDDDAAS